MTFDQNDIQSVALCAAKEARSDGLDACIAVMWVICNRAWTWRQPIHDVVYGKNQFTSMSVPGDPEFNWKPEAPADAAIYNGCLAAASEILNRASLDTTNGSHYYCNPKTATSGWFARNIAGDPVNHPVKAIIGQQTFYL